jgi:S1-C subfamily serine protease
MSTHRPLSRIIIVAIVLAFGLAGCSLGGNTNASPTAGSTTTTAAATVQATATTAAAAPTTSNRPLAQTVATGSSTAATTASPAVATAARTTASPTTGAPTTLPDVAGVAAKARPATVLVLNLVQARARSGGIPGQTTPGSGALPGQATPGTGENIVPQGAGSGFIYDPAGYIITNNHVVEGAQQLKVVLPPPDNRSFDAQLIGRDPQTDLAVIKIDGTNLPTVPLGNSSQLQIGEWVVAIGNALALPGGPTVTAGVVSATGRDEQEPGEQQGTVGPTLYDLIQTDAAINPGNSGGPLINMKGEVVGINTLGSTQAQGIGFSISIDGAKQIAQQLRDHGTVTRGYLGIGGATVTPSIAASLGLAAQDGVVIGQLDPSGPAAQAGLQQSDVIIGLGDVPVHTLQDLQNALTTKYKPGDAVAVKINRNGQEQTIQVTLGQKPPQ